jgi:hypothetical protein
MRYPGERMQRRWTARLARMPLLELQALLSAIGERGNKKNQDSSSLTSSPRPASAFAALALPGPAAAPFCFSLSPRTKRGGGKNFVTSHHFGER